MKRLVRLITVGVSIGLGANVARGHSVVVHTGTLRWDNNQIHLRLTANTHALDHEVKALASHVDRQQLLLTLARSIYVVAHNGARIGSARVIESTTPHSVDGVFDVAGNEVAVAVFHRPDPRTLGPIARQFQLQLIDHNTKVVNHHRLTSRGNYAVLLRPPHSARHGNIDLFNEPVMRIARDKAKNMTLHIDYPVGLLASWPAIDISNGISVSAYEFQRYRPQLTQWANTQLEIRTPLHQRASQSRASQNVSKSRATDTPPKTNKQTVIPHEISLIDPLANALSETDDTRYAISTVRVRFTFKLNQSDLTDVREIRWNGFNAKILRMPVLEKHDEQWIVAQNLTASQPTLLLDSKDVSHLLRKPTSALPFSKGTEN